MKWCVFPGPPTYEERLAALKEKAPHLFNNDPFRDLLKRTFSRRFRREYKARKAVDAGLTRGERETIAEYWRGWFAE